MADIDDALELIDTAESELSDAVAAIRKAAEEAETARDTFAAMHATGVAQLMDACTDSLNEALTACEQNVVSSLEDAKARAVEAKEAS